MKMRNVIIITILLLAIGGTFYIRENGRQQKEHNVIIAEAPTALPVIIDLSAAG
ncbi:MULTISPECIES: hypothetical protein [Aminobacterium]|nr:MULTISPECIES: hypothetical protein [Aminobacterium]MDD2378600.1 hypothetical protein [Aminobacterium colombiense]MDD3768066.1 hypothetical protein [Aminobacterium colombiense]MDD4266104.1 hypothetical protein [Aminobacterium colombiense]MDD4585256.1 hypothetical protein [Aminobacterium colombiense]NLK29835.1 hypothetical protein [Aminobacterium colombiense]